MPGPGGSGQGCRGWSFPVKEEASQGEVGMSGEAGRPRQPVDVASSPIRTGMGLGRTRPRKLPGAGWDHGLLEPTSQGLGGTQSCGCRGGAGRGLEVEGEQEPGAG